MNKKSYALIELIIVITIVGVLAAASSLYIADVINTWRFTTFRNEVVYRARIALLRMDREIRMLKPDDIGKPMITTAEDSRLVFTAIDLDADTVNDTVEFNITGSNLIRIFNNTPVEGNILTQNVNSLTFNYYNVNNQILTKPVADPTQIKRIDVRLEVRSGAATGYQTKALNLQIYPRNVSKD